MLSNKNGAGNGINSSKIPLAGHEVASTNARKPAFLPSPSPGLYFPTSKASTPPTERNS